MARRTARRVLDLRVGTTPGAGVRMRSLALRRWRPIGWGGTESSALGLLMDMAAQAARLIWAVHGWQRGVRASRTERATTQRQAGRGEAALVDGDEAHIQWRGEARVQRRPLQLREGAVGEMERLRGDLAERCLWTPTIANATACPETDAATADETTCVVVAARKAKAAIAAVAGFTPSPRADAGAAPKILALVFEGMSPMPGQMRRRQDRFAIGSKKCDCSKSGFRRMMSCTVSESQEYLYAPHHGRARNTALSLCNDGSKRRKCPCARMRTPCLIDLTYCYISTPARDGADRREERVVHCDQPCT